MLSKNKIRKKLLTNGIATTARLLLLWSWRTSEGQGEGPGQKCCHCDLHVFSQAGRCVVSKTIWHLFIVKFLHIAADDPATPSDTPCELCPFVLHLSYLLEIMAPVCLSCFKIKDCTRRVFLIDDLVTCIFYV